MKKFFQISLYFDDGTNIGWNCPSELNDECVFETYDDAVEWLRDNGYDEETADITECLFDEDEVKDLTIM